MSSKSKYDSFIEELTSLEKSIYKFIQKNAELVEFNKALQKKINQLDKENETLKLKVKESETEQSGNNLETDNYNNLNKMSAVDKQVLSGEINTLVDKINYHLRSVT
ncbi:MAG: hypothetical protein K9G44_05250 [Melioribacteraceae bacterium]|nr:hypothetical protein [Melioribacteraceae bacterium]